MGFINQRFFCSFLKILFAKVKVPESLNPFHGHKTIGEKVIGNYIKKEIDIDLVVPWRKQ